MTYETQIISNTFVIIDKALWSFTLLPCKVVNMDDYFVLWCLLSYNTPVSVGQVETT